MEYKVLRVLAHCGACQTMLEIIQGQLKLKEDRQSELVSVCVLPPVEWMINDSRCHAVFDVTRFCRKSWKQCLPLGKLIGAERCTCMLNSMSCIATRETHDSTGWWLSIGFSDFMMVQYDSIHHDSIWFIHPLTRVRYGKCRKSWSKVGGSLPQVHKLKTQTVTMWWYWVMLDVTPVNCLKLLTSNSLSIFGSFPMPFGNFPATVALGFLTRPDLLLAAASKNKPDSCCRRREEVGRWRHSDVFANLFLSIISFFALLLLNCSQADQLWDITSTPWTVSKWLRLLRYSKYLDACSSLKLGNSSQFQRNYFGKRQFRFTPLLIGHISTLIKICHPVDSRRCGFRKSDENPNLVLGYYINLDWWMLPPTPAWVSRCSRFWNLSALISQQLFSVSNSGTWHEYSGYPFPFACIESQGTATQRRGDHSHRPLRSFGSLLDYRSVVCLSYSWIVFQYGIVTQLIHLGNML